MDKKSSPPIRSGHVAKWRQKGELLLHFLAGTCSRRERREQIQTWRVFRERVCNFSLGFPLSDRRISSGQEAKWFYAARATCGHRFWGFLTNSVR